MSAAAPQSGPSEPAQNQLDRSWFDGWAKAMLDLQDQPLRTDASISTTSPPRSFSRTRIWVEAKAQRMMRLQSSRPPAEEPTPPEQTEPGRDYPAMEPSKTTEDQLRTALRAFGRAGAARAHWYLGTETFRAIESLGEGWNWGWLCQQPMAKLGWIADRLDRKLGREPDDAWKRQRLPLNKDPIGGGQYVRNQTEVPPRLEPPHNAKAIICSEMKGRVAGYDYWVDELTHHQLTSGDWRRIVGAGLKLMDQGRLKYSLQSWLKYVAGKEADEYRKPGPPTQDPEMDDGEEP